MFADILGSKLALFLDILVILHVLAVGFWIYSTCAEVKKTGVSSKYPKGRPDATKTE